ncbi:hypothetical protein DFH08DRAFT_622902, partial [Mycena albidolilacea]
SRIPTLVQRVGDTREVEAEAATNEEKSDWLRAEFFPPRMAESSVPPDAVYPPPAWKWEPVSDELLRRAADKMKPYKATFAESIPNCVIKQCTNLLIPFVGPIFRSLDELGHFPEEWSELRIPVLRKPGKADYDVPGAYRPIALTKGLPRWLYGAKDLQQVAAAEIAGILPKNQFG